MDAQELIKLYSGGQRNFRLANLREADLQEANLREADLQEANLREADLQEANLRWANLQWANLRGANLRGADLRGADLRGANLLGSDLWGADLRKADLRDTKYGIYDIFKARWDDCNDETISELMRWDAWFHPKPELFQVWSNGCGGYPCCQYDRAFYFQENRRLYQAGPPTMSPMELWVRLCKEHEIRHDFEEAET